LPSITRWSNVTETLPHPTDDDLAVARDRAVLDPVDAEDRDLGMVDQRSDEKSRRLAGAGHGEGAATQLLGLERAFVGCLGEALHLGVELVEGALVGAVDDRHDSPCSVWTARPMS
jgi:hypothetical protein